MGTSETSEDSSVTLQSQRELVDEIMTQGPHNATSTDLPPSSEPVVHDSSSLGKFLLQRECKFLDSTARH